MPHEIAKVSNGTWQVAVAAPLRYEGNPKHGDLRPVALEPFPGELSTLHGVPMRFTQRIHVTLYGRPLRAIMREGWDVVHCWQEPFVLAGGQLALWSPKEAAVVYTSFQNIVKRYPPPFNLVERYALARAQGWVANGVTIEETLLQKPIYRQRDHRLIWPGVDADVFSPDAGARAAVRASLGWNDDTPVIGYLGRLVESKGLPMLMRALERVPGPWRALFVGEGPLKAEIESWGAKFPGRVRVITGVGFADVPKHLNAMDVLVAPSQTTRNWREQFGRMLVEAFACGVPVIASDSGEIPYVVADAGIIVGETDEDAWTREIERVLADPIRRTELGQRGLERARTVFAWPIVARRYIDFFEEILARRERAGRR